MLGLLGGVLLAVMGYIVALLIRLNQRIRRLEHRDRQSWLYIKKLIDHIYKHSVGPIPEPPAGWAEDANE
jgi:hypothetical protein